MITINSFMLPPMVSMSMVHVGRNEIGYMSTSNPAVLDANLGMCTAAAAVNHDEATLIHFTPTGHFQREPIKRDYEKSTYRAFVMNAIHKDLPVGDVSKRSYLEFMTRCLEGKTWDVTMIYPLNLRHELSILTPFDIYNHLEKFASAIQIRRDTSVRVTPERIKGLNLV